MNLRGPAGLAPLLLAVFALAPLPLKAEKWSLTAERLLAADATFYAPPDFKRQLARNKTRLMEGVSRSFEAERNQRSPEARRAAIVRGVESIAAGIRNHMSFSDVAFETGGLVHEIAVLYSPPAKGEAARIAASYQHGTRFLGYTTNPFSEPKLLFLDDSAASLSARMAYDSALTLGTRMLSWIWNRVGGDVSITQKHPESKGPYIVRD